MYKDFLPTPPPVDNTNINIYEQILLEEDSEVNNLTELYTKLDKKITTQNMILKAITSIFSIIGYGGAGTIGAGIGYKLSNKSFLGGILGVGAGVLLFRYGVDIIVKLFNKLLNKYCDKLPKHEFSILIEKINEYKKNTKNEEDKQKLNKILQKIQNYVNNDDGWYDSEFKNYINSKISGF